MAGPTFLMRVVLVCVLAVLPAWVLGSEGDRSPKFQRCVASCVTDTCRNHRPLPFTDDTIVPSDPLPWYLVLTGWTCESNCAYHCTHRITNEAHKRVRDIRANVYDTLRAEQDALRAQHERWNSQLAWRDAGQTLDPACEGEAFSDTNGVCIPLMHSAPEPLWPESTIRQVAEERIQKQLGWLPRVDKQTVQFYGKWAQLRVLGMQEPFSVLFSVLNLVVHVYALRHLLREQVPSTYPLKAAYLRHARIGIAAWTASALFHTRDLWWTERLDYFLAAAVLLSGLFFTGCRIAYITPGTQTYQRWLAVCGGAWVLHVLYLLSHWRLDYSYNMAACTAVGVLHNLVWLAAAFAPHFVRSLALRVSGHEQAEALLKDKGGEAHAASRAATRFVPYFSDAQRRRLIVLVLVMFVLPGLELFDFPPVLRLIDAHALWHLSTAPITLYWYQWLAADAHECVVRGWKLDLHADEVVEVDDLRAAEHHSVLPAPGVSPIKAHTGDTALSGAPAPPAAIDELLAQVRRGLRVYNAWAQDALRRVRALLITQT